MESLATTFASYRTILEGFRHKNPLLYPLLSKEIDHSIGTTLGVSTLSTCGVVRYLGALQLAAKDAVAKEQQSKGSKSKVLLMPLGLLGSFSFAAVVLSSCTVAGNGKKWAGIRKMTLVLDVDYILFAYFWMSTFTCSHDLTCMYEHVHVRNGWRP